MRIRNALVVGGGGGIGAAVAQALSNDGWRIVVADIDLPAAEATAARSGDWARPVDVADEDSVTRLFEFVDAQCSSLDGLVYCSGVGVTANLLDVERQDWDRLLSINLTGAFLCCQASARRMAAQGSGSLVALSSVAGQRPSTATGPYTATKAALELLLAGFAMELGRVGIRANAVAPGATETRLVNMLHIGDRRARFTERIPLGRYATPSEIAATVAFLLSDEAAFITGQTIYVDGGMSVGNVLYSDVSPAEAR